MPEPVVVMLPVPNANTRVPVPELNKPVDNVKLAKFNVPPLYVKVFVIPNVSALPKVRLNELLIELLIVTLLLVIVLIAIIDKLPVFDHVVVEDKVTLPETVIPIVPVIVQVAPVVVKDRHGLAVPLTVIVGEPDAELIITSSATVGTEAPPEPPDAVDQLVVLAESQVPLPPTQYLLAI